MSYIYKILAEKPYVALLLDDTAPFDDYSGYGNTGSMNAGTVTNSTAVVSGATRSSVVDSAAIIQFPSPVFIQGKETQPFSLEANFRTVIKTTPEADTRQQVIGHLGQYDGIVQDGTKVAFVTKYLTAPECRAEFDIQVERLVHAVGVHLENKNQLYIDGVLVAEAEITDEQKADSFVATNGNLYCGQTPSTREMMVNGLSVYARSLSLPEVERHYKAAREVVPAATVAAGFLAERLRMGSESSDSFLKQVWETKEDWSSAILNNVVIQDEQLRPTLVAGVVQEGTWKDSFLLDAANSSSIYGVNLTWDGEGAVIEASVDGVVWEVAQRGKNLAIIPPGYDPTDKVMELRITFPAGIPETSFVDSLVVTGYSTATSYNSTTRVVSYTGSSYPMYVNDPILMRDDSGVRTVGASGISIAADTSTTPLNPKSMAAWIKKMPGTALNMNHSWVTYDYTGTSMSLGGSVSIGEWRLVFFTLDPAPTTAITITGDAVVGEILLFEDVLTTAQMQEIYQSYVGTPKSSTFEAAAVSLVEPAVPVVIYTHDWDISGNA